MNRRKGFTLVELLVVIAIIALLMGILMPALARVRRSARATACMVQLKQWGTVFSMYSNDFDGGFIPDYVEEEAGDGEWLKTVFAERLEEYYVDLGLLFCPSAKKTLAQNGRVPNRAWNFTPQYPKDAKEYYGSYAPNLWMGDLAPGQPVQYDRTREKRWRNFSLVKTPGRVPVFGDVCDYPRTYPNAYTEPPAMIDTTARDAESEATDVARDKLMNYCIRRHGAIANPNINICFADFSVRPVGLKALWSLRWHREWVKERKSDQAQVQWPEWMKNYSDRDYIEY